MLLARCVESRSDYLRRNGGNAILYVLISFLSRLVFCTLSRRFVRPSFCSFCARFVLVLCYTSLKNGNKHVCPCYSHDALLASEMPILSSSDNGRPSEALSGSLSQDVLVFFKNWVVIASIQFTSRAFIFSVHETGANTFPSAFWCWQWLSIASHTRHSLVQRPRSFSSAPKGARPLGREWSPSQWRNGLCAFNCYYFCRRLIKVSNIPRVEAPL